MTRLDANKKIIKFLTQKIKEYPNIRFIQLLMSLDIIDFEDRFYEESEITLKRISEYEEKQK